MKVGDITVREAARADLDPLLELYTHLHESGVPDIDERVRAVWEEILGDKNHHIIVAEQDGILVSSCVCVIVQNLTRGVRPYALIENVVTRAEYRRRGYASQCLDRARELAEDANCYKMMLLTGAKDSGTLGFYERAGYNREDKTAFVRWLGEI